MAAPAATPNPLTLSILSVSTSSSYDLVSNRSRSTSTASQPLQSNPDDSDDEIVWSVSEDSPSPASSRNSDEAASDDDFVVLSRPRSPAPPLTGISTPIDDGSVDVHIPVTSKSLEDRMNGLDLGARRSGKPTKKKVKKVKEMQKLAQSPTISVKQQKKKKKNATSPRTARNAYPSPAPSPKDPKTKIFIPSSSSFRLSEEISIIRYTGLGARPIVDDVSDRQSVISYDNESVGSPTLYEEASTFISSFLSNPDAKNDSVCRLTLLQSIIIELGLATPSLPESLTAAKAFLKSRAFLNIREYVAVREQGPEAVQRVMYPSKSALIKDIRKNPTSRKWVKQHGLQVLLVGWMQH
ncbi:hypothetical protein BDZ97DRAFT_1916228 [Flammula alnicola]|nr:hypothetical protein BDZ97DRAFT_1916228 [Flammula alnicola]